MKHYAVFYCILLSFFILFPSGYADAGENPRSKRGKNPMGSIMHLEDVVDTSDPDSLWYSYGKKNNNNEFDVFPIFVPKGTAVVSKDYNPKAYQHLKNMALYCNQQWRNQHCLKSISALGVDLTKDYMKQIHYSDTAPEDLKVPAQQTLRDACSGIVIRSKEEVIPLAMSDNLKECMNAITSVSRLTEEYPDHDLRQLAISSTFCIIRQPQCDIVEGQLAMIARPKRSEAGEVVPVK